MKGHFGPINTYVGVAIFSVLRDADILHTNRLAYHPSGKCYASGGEDGFVRVHHFDESYFKARPYGDVEIED